MSSLQAAAAASYPERRWLALFILLLAGFMNLIDTTIVNVALPRLQAVFGATSSQIEWVAAAYVLAFALGLLPFGRLGDTVGRKRMFLVGIAAFTLFSGLCGLAPDMRTLIAARVLQGISGAMMMPQVLAIVSVIFPPQERGTAFAFFGLSAGLASVAGPLTGGFLIDADLFGLDWRPIFLVNLPFGVLAIVAGYLLIPAMPGNRDLRHDPFGVLLAVLAIFLLIFPLVEGRSFGWPWWAFAMIAAAVAAMAAFYLWEAGRARRGETQLLPLSLMNNGGFMLGSAMSTIFFSGIPGFFLAFAIFLQTGFGFTPLESGLTTMPFPLGVLLATAVSGRLRGRFPRGRIAAGGLLLLVGMALVSWQVGKVVDVVDHWAFVPPLLLCGFGMGIAISSLFQTVLANVGHVDAGAGSGALQSFQQIGGAFGIAIVGEIFFSSLHSDMQAGMAPHAAFVGSLADALVYNLVAFAIVVLMVFLLKAPPPQAGRPAAVPVEA